MQYKGIDCSQPITDAYAQFLVDNGYSFVPRYIGRTRSNAGKILQPNEVEILRRHGLWILSIFEWYADRTKEGAPAGHDDGKWANAQAKLLGQPAGSAIFPCADFDTTPADYPKIVEYLEAFKSEIPDYVCGLYGEYDVEEEMLGRGIVEFGWQTLAWSRGKISNKIGVYQEAIDHSLHGMNVDSNICYVEPWNIGMWGQDKPIGKGEKLVQFTDLSWFSAQGQKDLLVKSFQDYYDKGLINDYHWVERASSGLLTESELGMINSVVNNRLAKDMPKVR